MTDWQQIVDEHGPLVWRLAYRVLGCEHEAADCYQTAFTQAFEASQRQTVDNWPGFLTRLTTARAIDALRARSRRPTHSDATAVELAPARSADRPVEQAQYRELVAHLRQALTLLPTDQAEVFCLRHFEQLANQEIALQLATTANHVGVLLHRAREALRKQLANINTTAEPRSAP